jgi:hypothetical protein
MCAFCIRCSDQSFVRRQRQRSAPTAQSLRRLWQFHVARRFGKGNANDAAVDRLGHFEAPAIHNLPEPGWAESTLN